MPSPIPSVSSSNSPFSPPGLRRPGATPQVVGQGISNEASASGSASEVTEDATKAPQPRGLGAVLDIQA